MYTNSSNIAEKLKGVNPGMSGMGAVDTQFAADIFKNHYNSLSDMRKLEIASNLIKGNTNPLTDEVVKVAVKFCSKGIWETFKDKVKSIFGRN